MGGFVENRGFQLHIGNFRLWLDKRLKGIQGEWTAPFGRASLCLAALNPKGFCSFPSGLLKNDFSLLMFSLDVVQLS